MYYIFDVSRALVCDTLMLQLQIYLSDIGKPVCGSREVEVKRLTYGNTDSSMAAFILTADCKLYKHLPKLFRRLYAFDVNLPVIKLIFGKRVCRTNVIKFTNFLFHQLTCNFLLLNCMNDEKNPVLG